MNSASFASRLAWQLLLGLVAFPALVAVSLGAGCANSQSFSGSDASMAEDVCPGALVSCSGVCADTQVDPQNCGGCGTACGMGQTCDKGTCATTCGPGTMLCGASCSDTTVDPQNCGGCGKKCPAGEVCSASACGTTCSAGEATCTADGGAAYCAHTTTDNANCGGCGTACGSGEVCVASSCVTACGTDESLCAPDSGTYCANTKTDNANCGGCGVVCKSGEICSGSHCSGTCTAPGGGQGTTCKGDAGTMFCANVETDNANCGGCGIVCSAGRACKKGKCVNDCAGADGGLETLCKLDGGKPYCADTETDNANCGGCGLPCKKGEACQGGKCTTSCNLPDGGPETICTSGSDTYCADTKTDNANCGACGKACLTGQSCESGVCATACTAPTTTCTSGSSWYCADLTSDTNNCGACGKACSSGQLCAASACHTLVGSYDVASGAWWSTHPPVYDCVQACTAIFGGTGYSCSTSNTTIDHMAWESCYADASHCDPGTPLPDSFSAGTLYGACFGYYPYYTGTVGCSCSAWVDDSCSAGTSINYCWQ